MPDTTLASWLLLGSFGMFLVIKVPITFSLAVSSIITAMYLKIPLMAIMQQMVQGVNSFSLLAIPFFIIAGEMMGEGGISRRLIAFSNLLVGRVRGGLAQVNVLASMFFGGISGSAVADVSSIGTILIPMMKKEGYDADYSVAVTVTSACQGIIIPPSHNMIIYSLAAGGVSVGRLFLGGFVPGVIKLHHRGEKRVPQGEALYLEGSPQNLEGSCSRHLHGSNHPRGRYLRCLHRYRISGGGLRLRLFRYFFRLP